MTIPTIKDVDDLFNNLTDYCEIEDFVEDKMGIACSYLVDGEYDYGKTGKIDIEDLKKKLKLSIRNRTVSK